MFTPPAWLGVIGGGQLGLMFAESARAAGYRVAVYSSSADSPATQAADRVVVGAYDDADAVAEFAKTVDALTFEFENISSRAAYAAAEHTVVRPQPRILENAQHRSREKQLLRSHGFPTAPFFEVQTRAELEEALAQVDCNGVYKTAVSGYDGHGQVRIEGPGDLKRALELLEVGAGVVEGWIEYRCELSVVVARNWSGEIATYGPMRNDHADHILDVSVYPAHVGEKIEADAVKLATAVAEALQLEGLVCVEMFLTKDGRLLINELAPRPHNSGHLTIEAFETSQFDQQVRTLCGLSLGSTAPKVPAAAMVNLLGDLWIDGVPDPDGIESDSVFVHLYGKAEPRRRRKMGHITALGATTEEARAKAIAARLKFAGLQAGETSSVEEAVRSAK
ncbi:MAG: 5-(carboxyamino)imidazole ribonucleotide synthase [Bryobacterales bacterium]